MKKEGRTGMSRHVTVLMTLTTISTMMTIVAAQGKRPAATTPRAAAPPAEAPLADAPPVAAPADSGRVLRVGESGGGGGADSSGISGLIYPTNTAVVEGGELRLNCKFSSTSPTTIRWLFWKSTGEDGAIVSDDQKVELVSGCAVQPSVQITLTLVQVEAKADGSCNLMIQNVGQDVAGKFACDNPDNEEDYGEAFVVVIEAPAQTNSFCQKNFMKGAVSEDQSLLIDCSITVHGALRPQIDWYAKTGSGWIKNGTQWHKNTTQPQLQVGDTVYTEWVPMNATTTTDKNSLKSFVQMAAVLPVVPEINVTIYFLGLTEPKEEMSPDAPIWTFNMKTPEIWITYAPKNVTIIRSEPDGQDEDEPIVEIKVGENLTCSSESHPSPAIYQWFNVTSDTIIQEGPIIGFEEPGDYNVKCIATTGRNRSSESTLSNLKVKERSLENSAAVVGETMTLYCRVPPSLATWKYRGPGQKDRERDILDKCTTINSADSARYGVDITDGGCNLILRNVTLRDAGIYMCQTKQASKTVPVSAEMVVLSSAPACAPVNVNDKVYNSRRVVMRCVVAYVGTGAYRPDITWTDVISNQTLASDPKIPTPICVGTSCNYNSTVNMTVNSTSLQVEGVVRLTPTNNRTIAAGTGRTSQAATNTPRYRHYWVSSRYDVVSSCGVELNSSNTVGTVSTLTSSVKPTAAVTAAVAAAVAAAQSPQAQHAAREQVHNTSYSTSWTWTQSQQGVVTIEVNPVTCATSNQKTFNTVSSAQAATDLGQYIDNLNNGTVIVLLSSADPMNYLDAVAESLTNIGLDLNTVGLRNKFSFVANIGAEKNIVSAIPARRVGFLHMAANVNSEFSYVGQPPTGYVHSDIRITSTATAA